MQGHNKTNMNSRLLKQTLQTTTLLLAAFALQACCTKAIKIPPRVDGENITLENARAGYYNLVVQMEACELCDADKDLADAISDEGDEIFELRSDELLTNEEYNAYIESMQVRLMEVRRVCNTLAIADKNANVPGNEGKYRQSEKAKDITAALNVALEHARETRRAAQAFVAGRK